MSDAFLLIDYPGYGKCKGYASVASMRASTEEALVALERHLGVSKIELEPRLCAIGHSLGSAVALDFAARHHVECVVAIAPFTTLREEAAHVVGRPLSYLLIENYDNRAAITELLKQNANARIVICHGTKDRVIPFELGRRLSALSQRIHLVPVQNAGHISVLTLGKDKILAAMNN